jgi:hypothetical protein
MDMQLPKPRAEHAFLQRLVGRWRVVPKDMPDHEDWIEEVRSLNGIWFVAEGRGRMPDGSEAATVLTLGHNGATGRYLGSWIGTMMEYLWVYDGELSPDGDTLSLYASGPGCDDREGMQDYREQIIFTGDGKRIFTSSAKQPDGSWKPFMTAEYFRIT